MRCRNHTRICLDSSSCSSHCFLIGSGNKRSWIGNHRFKHVHDDPLTLIFNHLNPGTWITNSLTKRLSLSNVASMLGQEKRYTPAACSQIPINGLRNNFGEAVLTIPIYRIFSRYCLLKVTQQSTPNVHKIQGSATSLNRGKPIQPLCFVTEPSTIASSKSCTL